MAFAFYSSFVSVRKEEEEKTKKLSQFVKSNILGTREAIAIKFGMWSAEVGGSVHSKNRLVSSRQHRAMEVRKLRFLSSCQYTYGCCAPASWAARHTTVCLDNFVDICDRVCEKVAFPHILPTSKQNGVTSDPVH